MIIVAIIKHNIAPRLELETISIPAENNDNRANSLLFLIKIGINDNIYTI